VGMTGVIPSRPCDEFERVYARAWSKCLTCPELEYKCFGELWYATRARAAGHLRRGAIVGSLRSCLIAIRFWILWFMRVLHGGGTDHGCTAPQVRVTCQRSGCTLASATMSSWARVEAAMTITPLPSRRCIGDIRWAAAAFFTFCNAAAARKGTDYGCARPQNG